MIVYLPNPLELWSPQSTEENKYVTVKLSSGGHIIAEPCEYNKLKVISISSTDPMDYLNNNLQPGKIISLQVKLDKN